MYLGVRGLRVPGPPSKLLPDFGLFTCCLDKTDVPEPSGRASGEITDGSINDTEESVIIEEYLELAEDSRFNLFNSYKFKKKVIGKFPGVDLTYTHFWSSK